MARATTRPRPSAPPKHPARPASSGAKVGAALQVAGTAAAVAAPAITAAQIAQGARKITEQFVAFLLMQRQRDRDLLARRVAASAAGLHPIAQDDIAQLATLEDRLGAEFERKSAERVAGALPQALALADPVKRDAAVRTILDAEHRFARQRSEAMFQRATRAIERLRIRQLSPHGALWRLSRRANHCPVCRFMAGGVTGNGRFWPWVVLDALHPPVHAQCGCGLHSYGDALANGWMTPADVPTARDALRAAQGIVIPMPIAEALSQEIVTREALIESGRVDPEQLALIRYGKVAA